MYVVVLDKSVVRGVRCWAGKRLCGRLYRELLERLLGVPKYYDKSLRAGTRQCDDVE